MHLRCPHCAGQEWISNLQGNWWVKCNSCGRTMQVFGVVKNKACNAVKHIECPNCGYSEENTIPEWDVIVTCPKCRYQWLIKADS